MEKKVRRFLHSRFQQILVGLRYAVVQRSPGFRREIAKGFTDITKYWK